MRFAGMTQQSSVKTARYTAFRGVDMSSDPTKVQSERSPYAPNLVSDSGGFPEKRVGWRTISSIDAPVNGLFHALLTSGEKMLAHGGTKLYDVTDPENPAVLKTGLMNAKSSGFVLNGRFWLLTGREYLTYDGLTVQDVSEIAVRPVTSIGRSPLAGGTSYDDVNLLTPKRENRFLADGKAVKYQLDTTQLDSAAVTAMINGTAMTEGNGFSVDRANGIVTFASAPSAPAIAGTDNVSVQFEKTVSGAYEKIAGCTIAALYGEGGDGYVFVSGNPAYPAQDFHSALRDPSYFPDNGYSLVGSETTAVMGYARLGEYPLILKKEDEQNSTIFLRGCETDNLTGDGQRIVFPLKAGISGTGMAAPRAVGHLADEPLFLSSSGVYAVTSNLITAERTVENRSYFADAALCAEKNLEQAVCTEWNGRFLVAVNGRAYVLDGRQAAVRPGDGKKVYECFYWINIPAVCFLPQGNTLYFGTADGRISRFNTDIASMARFNDDGQAICASWSTKADDDGNFMVYKHFLRYGCGIMIKPYARSGCTVKIRTERDFGRAVKSVQTDIFDFENVDFNRFSFSVNDAPQVVPFSPGLRRYITVQVIVENNAVNEGFGIFGIVRRYRTAGFFKR